MRRRVLPIIALIGAVLVVPLAVSQPSRRANAATPPYPYPQIVTGDRGTHDPSLLIDQLGSQTQPIEPPSTTYRYVVYSTHAETRVSQDRTNWAYRGVPFTDQLTWFSGGTPSWFGSYGDPWAPDVSYHDGQYWLYYAVAGNVRQHSAIAVATSPTGQPGTFVDHGIVISSEPNDPYNAIDPSLLVDAQGTWWLVFGSWWQGIFITQLNPATGKTLTTPPALTNLAYRQATPTDAKNIEAPYIWQHGTDYYLFVSFDYCCRGADSTYNIRVGRSTNGPLGPYYDDLGHPMLEGNATTVLATFDYVHGPGGQSVVHDPYTNEDLLVYHYYDSRLDGQAFLGINALSWTTGWPKVCPTVPPGTIGAALVAAGEPSACP